MGRNGRNAEAELFSDADHASEISRKSTSGSAALIQSDFSSGIIDFGCKQQIMAERSSGASETTAVDQLVKALAEADPIQAEVDPIQRCADRTKAAATICTRMIYPTSELV